jgi:hypothetical protein
VRRYSERIRALPRGGDPRWLIGAVWGAASVLAFFWILRLGRRHRRPDASPRPTAGALDDEYTDRLEDELAATD